MTAKLGRMRISDKFAPALLQSSDGYVQRLPRNEATLQALCDGIYVEEIGPDGKRTVYQKEPSLRALIYSIDRALGKPTERLEIEEPNLSHLSEAELRSSARRALLTDEELAWLDQIPRHQPRRPLALEVDDVGGDETDTKGDTSAE